MNRAVSNYTESTVDEEVLLNQELARRQREYRIMENDKQKVSQGTNHTTLRPVRETFRNL